MLEIQGIERYVTPVIEEGKIVSCVYIGPFMKLMCGCDFANMLKSKYIDESARVTDFSFASLLSSERIFEKDKKILLLDDNIGTGEIDIE